MTLAGCMNFRDLGGIRAQRGIVRSGVLFRTGHLSRLEASTAERLRRELGVRSYFDFRADEEIARDGEPSSLTSAGVRWQRHPFDLGDEEFAAVREPAPSDWASLYLRGFLRLRGEISVAIRALAREQSPAVFGCWAGKDRTGVVAGLLLSIIGVEDHEVARDYARTTEGLRAYAERFRFLWAREPARQAQIFAAYCSAPPEVMLEFLREVRARYGTPAEAVGADAGTVRALEERLLG